MCLSIEYMRRINCLKLSSARKDSFSIQIILHTPPLAGLAINHACVQGLPRFRTPLVPALGRHSTIIHTLGLEIITIPSRIIVFTLETKN